LEAHVVTEAVADLERAPLEVEESEVDAAREGGGSWCTDIHRPDRARQGGGRAGHRGRRADWLRSEVALHVDGCARDTLPPHPRLAREPVAAGAHH